MPEFDANEDLTRLPRIRRGARRIARTLPTLRRAHRMACGPSPLPTVTAPARPRRARCQAPAAKPPGTRG